MNLRTATAMQRRRKHGFTAVPSCAPSVDDGRHSDTRQLRPFYSRLGYPINFYDVVVAFVSGLLFGCSPAAVARFVIAVVVDSVKRMGMAWPVANVLKEVLKRVKPPVAYANASASITVKSLVGWVTAARLHHGPSNPLRRLALAVASGSRAREFFCKAATTFGVAAEEIVCPDNARRSAGASAVYEVDVPVCASVSGDAEATKSAAKNSFYAAGKTIIKASHDTSFSQKDCCGQSRFNGWTLKRLAPLYGEKWM